MENFKLLIELIKEYELGSKERAKKENWTGKSIYKPISLYPKIEDKNDKIIVNDERKSER